MVKRDTAEIKGFLKEAMRQLRKAYESTIQPTGCLWKIGFIDMAYWMSSQ